MMPGLMDGMRCCCGGHAASVLLAATAALGYWVLRHAEKDAGYVRWAGRVVGAVLLLGGLAGFLCGSHAHMRRARMMNCPHQPAMGGQGQGGADQLPPAHPPIPPKKR